MAVNFLRTKMIVLCTFMIEPSLAFTWDGALPYIVGFKYDESDPQLKKNGCDTTITSVATDYDK